MVEIYAVHRDEGWENAGEQAVSGVIFWDNGADLLIAAPARIVKDAEALKATFSDNTTYNATLKKQDRNLGLAIIAIKRSDLSDSTRNQMRSLDMQVVSDMGSSVPPEITGQWRTGSTGCLIQILQEVKKGAEFCLTRRVK